LETTSRISAFTGCDFGLVIIMALGKRGRPAEITKDVLERFLCKQETGMWLNYIAAFITDNVTEKINY
jgi:hypothetical protein